MVAACKLLGTPEGSDFVIRPPATEAWWNVLRNKSEISRRPFKFHEILGAVAARDPKCHIILKWPQTVGAEEKCDWISKRAPVRAKLMAAPYICSRKIAPSPFPPN